MQRFDPSVQKTPVTICSRHTRLVASSDADFVISFRGVKINTRDLTEIVSGTDRLVVCTPLEGNRVFIASKKIQADGVEWTDFLLRKSTH